MAKEIFISYSRKDFDKVKAIKDEIDREVGIDCWMDLDGIESGEQFEDVIISAINTHDTMLFMLSPNSMNSKYALRELNYAEHKEKRIILVYVEPCKMTDRFVFRYDETDTIDWNNPLQHNKLMGNLREWFPSNTRREISSPKPAGEGSVIAQYNKGCEYYSKRDFLEASQWFLKAANQGHVLSQYYLGWLYNNGKGVPQDYIQAVYWYKKAAEQGNADAQYSLGYCYAEGYGVKQDDTQAVYWYRKAAEQGGAYAQYALGYCYKNGKGVQKDSIQAVYWYKKAAEQGNANAQVGLGNCYAEGTGTKQDYAQAIYWYRKAAEQGNVYGQIYLGECYAEGEGVKKDLSVAAYWYKRAAKQGDEYAIKWLKAHNIDY